MERTGQIREEVEKPSCAALAARKATPTDEDADLCCSDSEIRAAHADPGDADFETRGADEKYEFRESGLRLRRRKARRRHHRPDQDLPSRFRRSRVRILLPQGLCADYGCSPFEDGPYPVSLEPTRRVHGGKLRPVGRVGPSGEDAPGRLPMHGEPLQGDTPHRPLPSRRVSRSHRRCLEYVPQGFDREDPAGLTTGLRMETNPHQVAPRFLGHGGWLPAPQTRCRFSSQGL
mmetsp:Transcript_34145/g.81240  ORF Transcript_34145/g.81240 Transcript_34145/m.81240 type:complete len:232 (-) Transcript_34145:1348-2043(-)